MSAQPKVSVVIPAYKQAAYLGAAIESVLNQSYHNFELIVVSDASPDQTDDVVARYPDPRLIFIEHGENQGLPAARNTGLRAATGEIFALLDADDLFHREKLAAHVAFLQENPTVGVSYNARYEISENGEILALWRPTTDATFSDVVLGFPFAPSDMVLRREWAYRVDFFDASYRAMSEDLDINCRLALAGCRFGGIDQALNYRRYYPNRVIGNVPDRVQGAERALHSLFTHPSCPAPILALRDSAFANLYLVWSYEAFVAQLTPLGQSWLGKAVRLDPSLLANKGVRLHEFLVERSIQDGGDHAVAVRQVIDQMPTNLQWFAPQVAAIVAEADLRAGIRDMLWGRVTHGEMLLKRAALTHVKIDQALLRVLVDQLLNYQQMIGDDAAQLALQRLLRYLRAVTSRRALGWMAGCYWLNRGIQSGKYQQWSHARRQIIQAFQADPGILANRGAWATLVKTLKPIMKQS
ncbi:MAG: glycosyltransferase family 2 protein [Caldilineaceae bacterium]|nr:glycosyltransferase family 2 protein [Caldilineaceae bacterium]